MDGWMDGRTDGRTDEWMNMDGLMFSFHNWSVVYPYRLPIHITDIQTWLTLLLIIHKLVISDSVPYNNKAVHKTQSSASIQQVPPYQINMNLEKMNAHQVLYEPKERNQQHHNKNAPHRLSKGEWVA